MRRVTVKVHIARVKSGAGAGALAAHLRYVQRDGVERDGSGGMLYDRQEDAADGRAFLERSAEDRHQFRMILSAEDAVELGDLKLQTRRLMAEMERDVGTRLDWVAVDHHNTGHPHTHVIIRGRDEMGRDLVIAPNYLMQGLRGRASQLITDELGPRRELDIMRAEQREISADRFTGLDRRLSALSKEGVVAIDPAGTDAQRFERASMLQRLRHLEGLHLAARQGSSEWRMQDGWEETLKALGRRGDIVRSLAVGIGPEHAHRPVRLAEGSGQIEQSFTGVVISQDPEDELRDTRFLLVEDLKGEIWHVPARGLEPDDLPPSGAVVEVASRTASPRQADHTIARIAAETGGIYSAAYHEALDPGASADHRLAHKRRLEALRMKGLVERAADGRWSIPPDYLERAAGYEAARGGRVSIQVRSWMAIETQVSARAETWLDGSEAAGDDVRASRIISARQRRLAFLREQGLLAEDQTVLPKEARSALRAAELSGAASIEAAKSGRKFAEPGGAPFEGRYERSLNLAQGRMALIGSDNAFALVPWRREMERLWGQALVIETKGAGMGWTFPGGRGRGIGR
jgi:type IV secretory pathway VirD2 relaxase